MEKKKVNIGLDIGVSSVGWCIIEDETNQIIDLGVRLFDDIVNSKGELKNVKRREARGARRRLQRIKTRKEIFTKFISTNEEFGVGYFEKNENEDPISKFTLHSKKIVDISKNSENSVDDEIKKQYFNIDITKFRRPEAMKDELKDVFASDFIQNPIELRIKALEHELDKNELIFLLWNYLTHRGAFYDEDDEKDKKNKSAEEFEIKKEFFSSQNIYEFYKQNKYYKNSIQRRLFNTQYCGEIRKILETQKQYHDFIDDQFIDDYLKIFSLHREFNKGPGSYKSPTKFGMYYYDKDGEVVKREGKNLYDALVGQCTYCENKRGLKYAPVSEVFNFLNDINNLKINNAPISKEQKEKIFGWLSKNKPASKKDKFLEKILQIIEKDSDKEIVLTSKHKEMSNLLNNYYVIKNFLLEQKILREEIKFNDLDKLNKINCLYVYLSSFSKNISEMKTKLSEKIKDEYNFELDITDDKVEKFLTKIKTGMSQTHSLCYECMSKFIEDCFTNLNSSVEQSKFFHNEKLEQYKRMEKKIIKNKDASLPMINPLVFNDEIISPTTKQSFTQVIHIFNAILKQYIAKEGYELKNVTVEMARDKNTYEERKSIEKMQKANKAIREEFVKEFGKWPNQSQLLRYKLWKEQDGRDIYDGLKIDKEDIKTGKGLDIDHIIPHSLCFDDSYNNKVLTKVDNNKEKTDQTPWQWLEKKGGKWKEFENRVQNNDKIDKVKKDKLLIKIDPKDMTSDFTGRHLVDTRYASRLVLNILQRFLENEDVRGKYGENARVGVIRGGVTSYIRNEFLKFKENDKYKYIDKNRDIFCHHAIDAAIIAWTGANESIKRRMQWYEKINKELNDDEFIESVDDSTRIDDGDTKAKGAEFAKQLFKYNILPIYDEEQGSEAKILIDRDKEEFSNRIKYSRKLTRKNNLPFSNETIYSFKLDNDRKHGWKIENKALLDLDKKKINEIFVKNFNEFKDSNKFITNKKIIDELKEIYEKYKDKTTSNVFNKYMQEKFDSDKNYKWVELKDGQRIKFVKWKSNKKDVDDIILLSSHNNSAMMESLNNLEIRIYKDRGGKYRLIGINVKVLQYDKNSQGLVINQEKLNEKLEKYKIEKDSKYISVNRGLVFIEKSSNELFYSICGGDLSDNKLDLKRLEWRSRTRNGSKQIQIAINTIVNKFDICEVDILGNIYNRKEISDFFK